MEAWPTVPIGELFKLKQGTYLKPNDMGESQSEQFPFPVYGANGVIGYSNRKMYGERTTLVSCRGANCGVVHYTVPNVWISNNSIACVPKADIDPTFYYYVCKNTDFGDVITGSAQPQITITNLSSKEFIQPPLPVQRRIAGILSAYDELMENSQRRVRLLEAMARALYREWFVHFRFPGHEKHPRVASPLGDIPQGWEAKKLGELVKYLNRGLSPSYDDNGDSKVINQKCIRDQRLNLEPARRQMKPVPTDKRVRFGDVLINSTGVGTLGRVAQVYQDLGECTVDSHVTIARPNTETDLEFFGCTLLSHQETFDRLGVGATGQTELSRTSIANVDLVVPPNRIQRRFADVVRPMRAAAATHANQIQNLRRTRDLLLPRLLSGQLSLEHAA